MNAVEIEEAVSKLAEAPFDPEAFPYDFLDAFGNKEVTLKRLMPADLRAAHDRNDETLERIYIGRRFKNDTERLEKLFELYTEMIARAPRPETAAQNETSLSHPSSPDQSAQSQTRRRMRRNMGFC